MVVHNFKIIIIVSILLDEKVIIGQISYFDNNALQVIELYL